MKRAITFLAIVSIALLAGCTADNEQGPASAASIGAPAPAGAMSAPNRDVSTNTDAANAMASTRAHAELVSTSDSNVSGRLSFVGTGQGVRVTGRISGLEPDSTHGFHIHENGDCGAPDASSAGGHFNPAQQPHGHPGSSPHHAGDIPNQHADANGVANVDVVVPGVELGTGSDTDILGRAIIVHAQADDYTSQPSGAAGARIACGVITRD